MNDNKKSCDHKTYPTLTIAEEDREFIHDELSYQLEELKEDSRRLVAKANPMLLYVLSSDGANLYYYNEARLLSCTRK